MLYLTAEEYKEITDKNVTPLDIENSNQCLKSYIHPNNILVEDWIAEYGTAPKEVKLAIVEIINYAEGNSYLLNNIPTGGTTIGSTSVSNSSYVIQAILDGSLDIPRSVDRWLKNTNLLSPFLHKSCRGIKLRGTPYDRLDFVKPIESTVDSTTGSTQAVNGSNGKIKFHTVEQILDTMPSVDIDLYIQKNEQGENPGVRVNKKFELYKTVPGWLKNRNYDNDESSNVIISAIGVDKIDLVKEIHYFIGENEQVQSVRGYNEFLNENGEIHHYRLEF